MKSFFVVILVLVIIAGLVVGGGYVVLNFGSKADVKWAESDLDSMVSKSGVSVKNIDELNVENIARGSYKTSGSMDIDTSFTSEEFTAMVASANDEKGPLKDFKINFMDDDQLELSFSLPKDIDELIKEAGILDSLKKNDVRFIMLSMARGGTLSLTQMVVERLSGLVGGKPIYAKGTLKKAGINSVHVKIDAIKVGLIPLDRATIDTVEEITEDFVNTFLASSNAFTLEELRIEDGKLYYKGTLPKEIEGIAD